MTDHCICCGAEVPEGRMVCWVCEHWRVHSDLMAAFGSQHVLEGEPVGSMEATVPERKKVESPGGPN